MNLKILLLIILGSFVVLTSVLNAAMNVQFSVTERDTINDKTALVYSDSVIVAPQNIYQLFESSDLLDLAKLVSHGYHLFQQQPVCLTQSRQEAP